MKFTTKMTALDAIATRARVNLADIDDGIAAQLLQRGFVEIDKAASDATGQAVVLTDAGAEHYRKALH